MDRAVQQHPRHKQRQRTAEPPPPAGRWRGRRNHQFDQHRRGQDQPQQPVQAIGWGAVPANPQPAIPHKQRQWQPQCQPEGRAQYQPKRGPAGRAGAGLTPAENPPEQRHAPRDHTAHPGGQPQRLQVPPRFGHASGCVSYARLRSRSGSRLHRQSARSATCQSRSRSA